MFPVWGSYIRPARIVVLQLPLLCGWGRALGVFVWLPEAGSSFTRLLFLEEHNKSPRVA